MLKETSIAAARTSQGRAALVRDAVRGHLPAMVDTSGFQVGRNSPSPTARSSSTPRCSSSSTTGRRQPRSTRRRCCRSPTINKVYVLDLAPGRSLIEHLVGQGHQVFVSWRNPDAEHGHFDFDTYAQAIAEARDAVAEITEHDAVNVMCGLLGRHHHRGRGSAIWPPRAGWARSRA